MGLDELAHVLLILGDNSLVSLMRDPPLGDPKLGELLSVLFCARQNLVFHPMKTVFEGLKTPGEFAHEFTSPGFMISYDPICDVETARTRSRQLAHTTTIRPLPSFGDDEERAAACRDKLAGNSLARPGRRGFGPAKKCLKGYLQAGATCWTASPESLNPKPLNPKPETLNRI